MGIEGLEFGSPKHLSLQVAEIIEKKILNKEIIVGEKLPPQEDLCKMFKVSLGTMKDALSDLVKEGYIARRRKYGTVVISSEPSQIVDLKTRNVVCIVICTDPEFETAGNQFFSKVISGVGERVKENSLHLMYKTIGGNDNELDFEGREHDIAGLIITGSITPAHLRIVKKTKMPFVLIGDVFQDAKSDEQVDTIANDDFQGGYMATKHLIDLGHRRIAYFTTAFGPYIWEKEYLRGYRQALKDAGIPCDKELEVEAGSQEYKKLYLAFKGFLEKPMSYTGLVCTMNERVYFAVMKAFSEKNIRVPEDISMVAPEYFPGVTSVNNDMEEMGRAAVERLIECLTNPDWKPGRVIIPNKLNAGDSTREIVDSR